MDKTSTAYKKAKSLADKTYEKHSAYKSMFISKKYKEFGGEYKSDDTKKDTNMACSHLEIFKDEYKECPISEQLSQENILIPNYPSLSEENMRHISKTINGVAARLRDK